MIKTDRNQLLELMDNKEKKIFKKIPQLVFLLE